MAVRTVVPAVINAGGDDSTSLTRALVAIVNDLKAAVDVITAQLDADAGVTDTDYAANVGTIDTIAFSDGNTPT